MGKLAQIFGGNIVDSVGKIISLFKLSPEVAAQHAMELQKIQDELLAKQIDATTAEVQAARDVIVAEATSSSWLPRNVRPLLLLLWGSLITINYLMGVVSQFVHVAYAPVTLPEWLYKLTAIGFTGYVGARTWEKLKEKD